MRACRPKQSFSTCMQLPIDEQAIQSMYTERIAAKAYPFASVRPEIVDMLQQLKRRGVKLGLISNCTEEEVRDWYGCPLAEWFDCTLFSYAAGVAKPDTAIYRMACDQLCIPPEEALFIGDGGSDELAGAGRAGMRSYHAFWFNKYIASDYPKLTRPAQVLELL